MVSLLENTRLGSQIPRINSFPPYSDLRPGQLAIKISELAGQTLDPWQAHPTQHGLGQNNGKWSAREVACVVPRQNGKGAIIIARELAGLFVFREELIIHTAHRFNTSEESFRRITGLIKSVPELDRQVKQYWNGSAKKGIELRPTPRTPNGQFLRFLARSRDSARGLTANCLIIDEAYGLSTEEQSALNFTVSAVPNHQIWYFSTPPLDVTTGEPLYKLRERGLRGDPRLAYFDWGATADVDLDDQDVWWATNPALGIRIELDTIAAERDGMSVRDFARERLGIWPENVGITVIDPKTWNDCKDEYSEAEDPIALAVDVAPSGAFTSIGIASRREDERVHIELAENRPGTSWVIDRIKDLVANHKPVAVALNPSSPAGALVVELELAGIELLKVSGRDYTAACVGFADAVREDALRHRDDQLINEALVGARTKLNPEGAWYWTRKDTTTDISPLVAITLARHAFLAKSGTYRKPYDLLKSVW